MLRTYVQQETGGRRTPNELSQFAAKSSVHIMPVLQSLDLALASLVRVKSQKRKVGKVTKPAIVTSVPVDLEYYSTFSISTPVQQCCPQAWQHRERRGGVSGDDLK